MERQYTEEEMAELDLETPAVVGMTVEEAQDAVETAGLVCRVEGDGDTVLDQIPLMRGTASRRTVRLCSIRTVQAWKNGLPCRISVG